MVKDCRSVDGTKEVYSSSSFEWRRLVQNIENKIIYVLLIQG